MAGGLRYETGRDMPPGMVEKAAVQIARQMELQTPAEIATSPAAPRNDSGEQLQAQKVAEIDESVHTAPDRLISAKRLYATAFDMHRTGHMDDESINDIINLIDDAPTVAALPVTAEELAYLIGDTISYIWKLENKKRATPEFGYDERKALLEKLKRFREEHFTELHTCGP